MLLMQVNCLKPFYKKSKNCNNCFVNIVKIVTILYLCEYFSTVTQVTQTKLGLNEYDENNS